MEQKVSGTKGFLNLPLIDLINFDGQELYPDPVDKAAAIFESIVTNHPFIDGNKRTAFVLMRLMLKNYSIDINIGQNEKYDFVIKAASGHITFDQIRTWINDSLK